jgi:SAM-dependent methyltransferase
METSSAFIPEADCSYRWRMRAGEASAASGLAVRFHPQLALTCASFIAGAVDERRGLSRTDGVLAASDLSETIIAHYERHATHWDADRRDAAWNDRKWHDRFVSLLPAIATVLDLGCGGGSPVASNLVAHGKRVTGVDSSPNLIALCRERMPGQEWIVADMRSLKLGRTFDGILAWDSFFHLSPDAQRAMFSAFAAHSHHDTVLMFNTGPAFGEAIGSYRGDPLYHASLDRSEYEQSLATSGFRTIDQVTEDPEAGGRTVWLAARVSGDHPCSGFTDQ